MTPVKPPPQPVWEWASGVFYTFDAQIVLALIVSGSAGILWHYFCQARKGQVPWCFTKYMLEHPGATASSIMALVAAIAAMSGFSVFYENGEFVGWWKVMVYGFGVGLMTDVSLNRAEPPDQPRKDLLTEEERAAVRSNGHN